MSFSEISKPHYSPDELAGILRDVNLEAEVETQGDGRKVIMVTAPGLRFAIFTHGPKGDADIVTTVTFRAYFAIQTTFEEVNEWNLAKRFVSAYRDADGELASNGTFSFNTHRQPISSNASGGGERWCPT